MKVAPTCFGLQGNHHQVDNVCMTLLLYATLNFKIKYRNA